MRIVQEKLAAAQNAATSFNSGIVDVRHIALGNIQAVWTNTIKGVLKVQGSNDISTQNNPYVVTNWTDIPSATATAAGSAGSAFIPLVDLGVCFIRCVYTADGTTPGTGTMTLTAMGKGV